MPGKRSREGKRKQEIRRIEYERQQAMLQQERIALDYLLTHNKIARKNEDYPLTEKVLTGTPEELKALLSSELLNPEHLEVNPFDFPEGLVIPQGERFFDVNLP